jgi:ketosteroid isomerase-like protein
MPQTSPFMGTIIQWQTYANAGNTTGIQNLYAQDAAALFTEGTPSAVINGAADIAKDLAAHFGPNNPYQDIQLVEVNSKQLGNGGGWSYGTWTASVPDPNNPGKRVQQPGSWSVIWTQGSGNTPWLIQVHAVVPYIPGT